MDKSDVKVHESQLDTSSVITMKEYAPSEYPSSEPPPAYMKPRSNALRIAKLAAFTVIVSSIILGGFILAASWIQANTAKNLDLTLNQELLDDLHPNYEHLVANEVLPEQQHNSVENVQSKSESSEENQSSSSYEKVSDKSLLSQDNEEGLIPPPPPPPFHEKPNDKNVLDLDEVANILMQKNIKGNVNCVVEKRRNEELVDHAPMSLNLPSANFPFGLNITTPPRLQHLTGEQVIVICKGDDDEKKNLDNEEVGNENENQVDDMQPIIFPLPDQLLHKVQHIPQIIPLNSILQHIQLQQVPREQIQLQQLPVQQIPIQQIPLQQIPVQQVHMQQIPVQRIPLQQVPIQQLQMQQIPVQRIPLQQIPIQQLPVQQIPMQQVPVQQIQVHNIPLRPVQIQQIPIQQIPAQNNIPQFRPQPQPQPFLLQQQLLAEQQKRQQLLLQQQRQPQPQIFLPPQKLFVPQQQQQVFNNQPNIPAAAEIIPLKEIRINPNRIPVNHVLHHRMPINSMAVSDIPISRMQITHLPIRGEPQIKEEPVPVHHLMPPQAQQYQAENFKQDEPRFNEPPIQFFPQQNQQPRPLPVEVRDPGVLRMPAAMNQEPREPFSMPPPVNPVFQNNLVEHREPSFVEENRNFRPLTVDVRPRGQRREPMVNTLMPEMPKIFPLNFERRPADSGRKIRFPEVVDSEEVRENHLPIITEITKIIPIRLEKEDFEDNDAPIIPLNPHPEPKNIETPEIKIEKVPPRPFPIPINAILDMIFRGIRPFMNRNHPFPIPIDIKIERIENKPLRPMPPFLKKFEILKKESPSSLEEETQNSHLEEKNENEENADNDKGMVQAKIERVEIFNREHENGHPIPIPVDAQDPEVFKLEEQEKQTEANEQSTFDDQAFLPNGQGRGARVFPIPQSMKESEIFSVFDAKTDKSIETEVPAESSSPAADTEKENTTGASENRQGRIAEFPSSIFDIFSSPEHKPIKPVQPQAFIVPESLKLYPVPEAEGKTEELKPPMANANIEESRPHFVQPRSV